MSTAFLFPGLNALKRNKDRARFLSNPIIFEQLERVCWILNERFGLRINAQQFLNQPEQVLYSNENLAITAVLNTTIQVAISQQLKQLIDSPVCLMGYSQGDIARSVCAEMIEIEQAVIHIYEFFNAIDIEQSSGENIGIRTKKNNAFSEQDLTWFKDIGVDVSVFTPYYLLCSVNQHQLELISDNAKRTKWDIKQSVFKYPVHSKLLKPMTDHVLKDSINNNIRFKSPVLPVYSSILNKPLIKEYDVLKETQLSLYSPVNWLQAIYDMVRRYQVETIVNIGPCRSISLMLRETPVTLKVIEADKLLADRSICLKVNSPWSPSNH